MLKLIIKSIFLSLFFFSASAAFAADEGRPRHLMAWANNPELLNIVELRQGCSGDPILCVKAAGANSKINYNSISFVLPGKTQENIDRARLFSKLSLENDNLKEIGIDDLASFVRGLPIIDRGGYLNRLVDEAKSINPKLNFGVTVYEDEIDSLKGVDNIYSQYFRGKIDRVAFYLHYRGNVGNYDKYLKDLKNLFPSAKIYGGVYHYDRIDYVKCYQSVVGKCSLEKEVELFTDLLKIQASMLKVKEIDGLEFYPGFLGHEESWGGWSNERICSQLRKQECIDVSKKMASEVVKVLQ